MAHLAIRRAGPGCTIQDAGRFSWRRYGVTPSGPMDWVAFHLVHHALGNPVDAAALEISTGGLEASVDAPLDLAFAGGGFSWTLDGKPLAPAMRLTLHPGQVLGAHAGPWGAWTYLAPAGGFDTPREMGSRATHLRSGIGGRMIAVGDKLPIAATPMTPDGGTYTLDTGLLVKTSAPIRVLLGPQDDYFTEDAIAGFFNESFTLTPAADRMAYRFDGPKIAHRSGFNIVSDGIPLGAVQVGGDGEPLILMADHQPTGGYPKLGCVIRADIGRLAQLRPGESVRFAACDMAEARNALFALEDEIAASICQKQTPAAGFSNTALRRLNLIDGVVRLSRAEL